jgi:hypothetical protein
LAYAGLAIVAIVWLVALVGVGETIARRPKKGEPLLAQ